MVCGCSMGSASCRRNAYDDDDDELLWLVLSWQQVTEVDAGIIVAAVDTGVCVGVAWFEDSTVIWRTAPLALMNFDFWFFGGGLKVKIFGVRF